MGRGVDPAENAANVELLRRMNAADPAGPDFPTSGTAGLGPSGKLHGRYATVALAGGTLAPVINLYCFEWEIEWQQDFADGHAFGDFWKIPIPVLQSWTGRVKGFAIVGTVPGTTIAGLTQPTYLWAGARNNATALGAPSDPQLLTFNGYSDAKLVPQAIATGSCYASRVRWSAPNGGMVTQEMELMGYGPLTAGVPQT